MGGEGTGTWGGDANALAMRLQQLSTTRHNLDQDINNTQSALLNALSVQVSARLLAPQTERLGAPLRARLPHDHAFLCLSTLAA